MVLRGMLCFYGVPEEFDSDGASVLVSGVTKRFMEAWGVKQRISSAYFPQSNLRAETAVKSMKQLINANTGQWGTLDTDAFGAAML